MITSKRGLAYGLATLLAGLVFWGASTEFRRGKLIDTCVEKLVSAAAKRNIENLEVMVSGRIFRSQLLSAYRVESVYARPNNEQWARIGVLVQTTASATTAGVHGLLLNLEHLPACEFVRDYEAGAFGAHGRASESKVQK
jgi:hypothetical protein